MIHPFKRYCSVGVQASLCRRVIVLTPLPTPAGHVFRVPPFEQVLSPPLEWAPSVVFFLTLPTPFQPALNQGQGRPNKAEEGPSGWQVGFNQPSLGFWLFLVVFGCFWLFLVVFGCFWLFLVVFGCFWLFLVVFGCFQKITHE